MKHLYLLLILFGLNGFSQNYIPFPTENVAWIESYSGMETLCGVTQYYTTGDTIIGNQTYQKLRRYYKHQMSDFFGNCNGMLQEGDYLKGFYRNDSINKRVLWQYPNDTTEYTLIRFDFNIGDTLDSCLVCGGQIVTDIDSVLIDSEYHKRFKIDSCYQVGNGSENYIIEGIGSLRGMFEPIFCPFEQFYDLTCFINDGYYHGFDLWGGFCDYVSTHEIESKDLNLISIFPNPTHSKININFGTTKFSSISIIDLSGRTLKEINTNGKSHVKIDLYQLSKGCYIFQLKEESGNIRSKRIIKQ